MKYFQVFITSLRLGLTSFGGPIAHLAYFREEYVVRKKWISDQGYADLVALCQFLPGPASSQVGMAIGLSRAGILGAFLSWFGFTLPSALLLVLFGIGMSNLNLSLHQHWLHGLKVIAVSVVAQAVLGMAKKLCPDKERITLAIVSLVIVLLGNSAFIQILVLFFAGMFGVFFFKTGSDLPHEPIHKGGRTIGAVFLFLFFALLLTLPIARNMYPYQSIKLFDSFYRAGALVFGGGHVVLPLLQAAVVPSAWVTNDLFLAGYGVANAIPGPLFAFGSYLGAVSQTPPNGILGGILCTCAIFLPSFLLIVGTLPFWESWRRLPKMRQAMMGLNASVVGILLAALYDPVWTSAIYTPKDFAVAITGLVLLEVWKVPSWVLVLLIVLVSFFIF